MQTLVPSRFAATPASAPRPAPAVAAGVPPAAALCPSRPAAPLRARPAAAASAFNQPSEQPEGRGDRVVARFRDDRKPGDAPTGTQRAPGAPATHLVPVVLKYGKKCAFGEHYAVVGSVPELGAWDPTKAVAMKWTAGDVWTAVIRLPVNTEVQYKYVRRSDKGHVVAWEGTGSGDGSSGNISLVVTPGHRLIWGHGVEVHADLPAEYSDIAGTPLSGTAHMTTVTGVTPGTASSGSGSGSGGPTGRSQSPTAGVVNAARDALAAIESKVPFLAGHRNEVHNDPNPNNTTSTTIDSPNTTTATGSTSSFTTPFGTTTASTDTAATTLPTSPAPTTAGTTSTPTGTTTATPGTAGTTTPTPGMAPPPDLTMPTFAATTPATDTPVPANASAPTPYALPPDTPAPGAPHTTIGEVAARANAPGTLPGAHVAPAANDVNVVDSPHITSTDLASSLIAAGPAAAALSAAAVGSPADEAGNIPVISPSDAPHRSQHGHGHSHGGVGASAALDPAASAPTMEAPEAVAPPPPPSSTVAGAAPSDVTGTTITSDQPGTGTTTTATTSNTPPTSGGRSGSSGRDNGNGLPSINFFRRRG